MKKAIIAIVIIFVLLIGTGVVLNCTIFSKEYKVKEYLNSYVDGDYEKIMEMLNLEESHFINEKVLSNEFANPYVGIKDYEIKKIKRIDDNTYYVDVDYEYDEDHAEKNNVIYNEKEKRIVLKKSKTKKFVFFDKWYIKSRNTIKNVEFKLPKNTLIYFNDVLVTEDFITNKGNVDIYRIPELLDKTYEIRMQYEFGENQKIYWNPKSLGIYNMTLDLDNTYNYIIEISDELVNELLTNIKEKKSYKEFVDSLNCGDYATNLIDVTDSFRLEDNYNEALEKYKQGFYNLEELKISNYRIYKAYINKSGILQINLVFDYETVLYFEGEAVIKQDREQIKLYYVYDNGKLKLQDIRNENFIPIEEDF